MKRLYYLRHGLSELNVAGKFAGLTNTPLTPAGKRGAHQAGKDNRGIAIDIIVASPLSRAHETAKLFASGAGLTQEIIITNPLLVERNFGSLELTTWTADKSHNLMNDNLPEGVEPWDDMVARAQELLDYAEKLSADSILLVGHGGIGRALRSIVQPDTDIHQGIPNSELVRWI